MFVIVCHQYDVCKNYVDSVYVGMVVSAKADSIIFRELCPVSFLVVGKSPSVLL